jgi:hypothetical protein
MTSNAFARTTALLLALPVPLALGAAAAAQGLPRLEAEFPNGATLRFYGQINKGILSYDDGIDEETYFAIDNDNSGTRFGLRYTQSFGAWTFENVNEFEYAPYSTANINIIDDSPSSDDYEWGNHNIRKIDFSFEHERYGTFWIGQGSMATDGVAGADLSGTDVIGASSVGDSAGAQIIRYSDPDLLFANNPQIGQAFSNYDGGRLARVRYDTPSFNGFSVALAYGQDLLSGEDDERDIDQYDVALLYENAFETFDVAAAVGYYGNDDDATVWVGSASALHTSTGINGTFAAGTQEFEDDSGSYWYAKLGLLRDFVAWGDSALAIDYYSGDDIFVSDGIQLFDGDGNPVLDENGDPVTGDITSSESTSWGLSVVQNVDAWNTEFWLTYRSYDYSDDFASYEDGQAIFGGARFSF